MLQFAEAPTAGGAAFDEILIAGAIAGVINLFTAWEVYRERGGHRTLVGRAADAVARVDGLPRWCGLPVYLATLALISCAFGVWWDVPIHMQNGRDEGPLANGAHYPIFLGIVAFANAGILSIGLARGPLPRRTVRLSRDWQAPLGGFVIAGAGLIALVGFPADDVWHRLFGQDVTEWGPTHVMMIGGAVTCPLGFPLLLAEARQVGAVRPGRWGRWREAIALGLCVAPIAFLMEFDLGVPQFPAATQFLIFAFLAAWIACAVRIRFGPGGALVAWLVYLVLHAFVAVTVWLLPDVLVARFLLFLPSALLVEAVALVLPPARRRTPFLAVSALLVGSLGMVAEWWWGGVFMPLPQPFDARHLAWIVPLGVTAALAGALLAHWHTAMLARTADPEPPVEAPAPATRWAGLAALVAAFALMAAFAPPSAGDTPISGTVTFDEVSSGGAECQGGDEECTAVVTVKVEPADALDDAVWVYSLSWQGRGPGGHVETAPLDPQTDVPGIARVAMEPTGVPGEYRTLDPVPLYGHWKTLIRMQLFPRTHLAFPLHAPDDPAIASERGRQVVTTNGEVVEAVTEKQFLQREQKDDVPTWLFTIGYSLVVLVWLVMLLFFGWCYARAGSATPSATRERVTA